MQMIKVVRRSHVNSEIETMQRLLTGTWNCYTSL